MPITDEQLKQILEAAIMASTEPMSVDKMLALFVEDKEPPTRDAVKDALQVIEQECQSRGVELKKVSSGYRFQAKRDMSPWVSRLWEEKPARYSRALLETLVLIAYKQPITRGEIEHVRGVAVSTNIIKTLLEREWVRVVGHRDVPGKPALYATTKAFLDYFNLKSLEELPTLAEIRDLDKINAELELQEPGTQPEENAAEGEGGEGFDESAGESVGESAEQGADQGADEDSVQIQDQDIVAAAETAAAAETVDIDTDTAEVVASDADSEENTVTETETENAAIESEAAENAVIENDATESDETQSDETEINAINEAGNDTGDQLAAPDEQPEQVAVADSSQDPSSHNFQGDEQTNEQANEQESGGLESLAREPEDIEDTKMDVTLSPVDRDYSDDDNEDIDSNLDDRDVVVLDESRHVVLQEESPGEAAFDDHEPVTTMGSADVSGIDIDEAHSPEHIDQAGDVISSEIAVSENELALPEQDFSTDPEITAEPDQDTTDDDVYSVASEADTDAVTGTFEDQDRVSDTMSDANKDDKDNASEASESQSRTPKAQAGLADGDLNDDTGTLETATVDSDGDYSVADDYDSRFGG